jgi:Fe-Mn family superoxide dismutase
MNRKAYTLAAMQQDSADYRSARSPASPIAGPAVDRRTFIAAAAAAAGTASVAFAQSAKPAAPTAPAAPAEADGPFTLPPLPYAPEALEPAIDAETMRIHHGKHHAAYVKNLNAAVKGMNVTGSVESLIAAIDALPADKRTAIRNNGGGHANHSLFWLTLAPKGTAGEPTKELAAAIEKDLGGMTAMRDALTSNAMARFGSGWSWLIVTPERTLAVTNSPNQDSPLMRGIAERPGTPIFGIDVWEHAYYLKYQNRRADYVKAVLDSIAWTEVSKRYAAALA